MLSIDDLDEDLTAEVKKPRKKRKSRRDLTEANLNIAPAALVPDSPTAKALWRVWSGGLITVVDSPPGGGKSAAVATLAAHLAVRGGLSVVVGTPTRRAALEIALRIAQQVPGDRMNLQSATTPVPGLYIGRRGYESGSGGYVTIRTLDSCKARPPQVDVLIVDEAYQCTFAKVAVAAEHARQLMLVGDPGQIGPVVAVDTSVWEHMANAPHRRAPEVYQDWPDTGTIHIATSYRLGQASVEAIAPLYDFPFESGRPGRVVIGKDGRERAELESIEIDSNGSIDDIDALSEVADLAASFVGATQQTTDCDETSSTVLGQGDVAVVVSRNSQANIIAGLLRGRGLADIAVGTADRLQGGQWHAVVTVDPAFGYTEWSPFMTSLGRLCVSASRHMSTLLWVHDGNWRELFEGDDASGPLAATGIEVREKLTANDITPNRSASSAEPQSPRVTDRVSPSS